MRIPQQLAAMRQIMAQRRADADAGPHPAVALTDAWSEARAAPIRVGFHATREAIQAPREARKTAEPRLDPPEPGAANDDGFPFVARIRFQGLPQINVEQRRGEVRRGDGWSVVMPYHYGELRDTEGVDGDPVDVCVGPDAYAPMAYIVRQKEPGRSLAESYDEDKVLVGFRRKDDAIDAYRRAYDKPGFIGEVITMTVGELQAWLENASNRGKKIVGRRIPDGAKGDAGKALQTAMLIEDATSSSPDDCQDCGWNPCRCEAAKAMPEHMRWVT